MAILLIQHLTRRFARVRTVYICVFTAIACCHLLACTAEPPIPLRLGTNIWPGYEPLYLARELKFLDTERIHLVEYSSATEVLRAYRNKAIDAAALTLDEVLLLAQDGEEPRIVIVLDYSYGADAILARPPIDKVAALRGHRIAAEHTALGAYFLQRALNIAKLEPRDIIVVPATVDEHESIYTSGKVDAVVTFEPVRSRLLQAGANSIFDSKSIPGEILDVLAVRRSYAERHPEELAFLVEGWFKALDYINTSRADASQRMAAREQLSPEEFMVSLEGIRLPNLMENHALLGGRDAGILTSARRLAQTMSDNNLLQYNSINIEALPYSSPLDRVIDQQGKHQ